jgi:hypothetical protein
MKQRILQGLAAVVLSATACAGWANEINAADTPSAPQSQGNYSTDTQQGHMDRQHADKSWSDAKAACKSQTDRQARNDCMKRARADHMDATEGMDNSPNGRGDDQVE